MDSWNIADYVFDFDTVEGSKESWLLRKLDQRENVSSYTSIAILYGDYDSQATPTSMFHWADDEVESP